MRRGRYSTVHHSSGRRHHRQSHVGSMTGGDGGRDDGGLCGCGCNYPGGYGELLVDWEEGGLDDLAVGRGRCCCWDELIGSHLETGNTKKQPSVFLEKREGNIHVAYSAAMMVCVYTCYHMYMYMELHVLCV